jgi:hypothetical protein
MTFRLSRLLIAAPILASITLLSPASGRAPEASSRGPVESPEAPSRLDYVAFASLADSSSLWAMAAYRGPERQPRSD